MGRLALGYPDAARGGRDARRHAERDRVLDVEAVADVVDRARAQAAAGAVHSSEALRHYVWPLCEATRADPRTVLGGSRPRAALLLFAPPRRSLLWREDLALPDEVQALAPSVLSIASCSRPRTEGTGTVVRSALERVPAL